MQFLSNFIGALSLPAQLFIQRPFLLFPIDNFSPQILDRAGEFLTLILCSFGSFAADEDGFVESEYVAVGCSEALTELFVLLLRFFEGPPLLFDFMFCIFFAFGEVGQLFLIKDLYFFCLVLLGIKFAPKLVQFLVGIKGLSSECLILKVQGVPLTTHGIELIP